MQISAGLVILKNNQIGLIKPKGLGVGQYSIPKGLVNKDETILEAAIRETNEESGLTIEKDLIDTTPHIFNYISQNGQITKRVYYFVVNIDNKIILDNKNYDIHEVESFGFYDISEAERLIYWKQLSVLNHLMPDRFSIKELRILESLNIIKKIKHPLYPIFLYNYTDKCKKYQFWNNTTLWCRGLVLDINGRIVARPFKKFFEERQLYNEFVPKDENFKVTEKLDGALGLLFFYQGKIILTTRQSFKSRQVQKALKILYRNYSKEILNLDSKNTYLFEIIYPDNRFITNYGSVEDLFLLDIVENYSGASLLNNLDFPKPNDLNQICLSDKKTEGIILRYINGLRIKIKYDYYKNSYAYLSTTKKQIVKGKKFLEEKPETNNSIRVDFKKLYYMYNKRYLELYISHYKKNKSLNEEEIILSISKRDVFPG